MPANNAFHQVKSLLGRMDRSIDEARHRRLGVPDDDTEVFEASDDDLDQVIGSSESDADERTAEATRPVDRRPSPLSDEPVRANASKFGRAKPLRPAGEGTNGW